MNLNDFKRAFEKRDENGDVYQSQPSGKGKGAARFFGAIILVIIVIWLGSSAFYNVGEQEQAVLTMFGRKEDAFIIKSRLRAVLRSNYLPFRELRIHSGALFVG